MKLTIKETAEMTGVSVRTLHYYDEIGLLKPDYVDEQNGYRYYGEAALGRLQEVLFYRELDFPLKKISEIMASPRYDKSDALSKQRSLLELKAKRLGRLIDTLDVLLKGENSMNFEAFDTKEYDSAREKYAGEVKERWGDTDEYRESEIKLKRCSSEKWTEINAETDSIMAEFAECMKNGNSAESAPAQALVKKWQDSITKNYYTCTKEILASLGSMYTADERFKANIDRAAEGTAEFISRAIAVYCRK